MADLSDAPEVAIIGCGNPNRSDDGVGPHIVRLLRTRDLPNGIALFDAGTDGMSVMFRARGAKRLIVVDARAPNGAPGAIYKVPGEMLATPPQQSFTLHDFRWDHALYAGRQIYGDDFPEQIDVLLIEAARLDLGLELTPAVAVAAMQTADRIVEIATTHVATRE